LVVRCTQKQFGLIIAKSRRLAFVGFDLRALDAMDRMPPGERWRRPVRVAPGERAKPTHASASPTETHPPQSARPNCKSLKVILIGATDAGGIDVGKPLNRSGHSRQVLKLDRRQTTLTVWAEFGQIFIQPPLLTHS
jgi:hypothetical protein